MKSFLKMPHRSINDCFFICRLSKAADLDHHWVAKAWLSDVGLPQYSQAFHNHLVDGRMLNSLTRHDLERHLNITKKFHQISLLLGIELLQLLQFDKEVRKSFTQNRLQVWMWGRTSVWCQRVWPLGPAGPSDTVWAPKCGSTGLDVSSSHQVDQRHWFEGGNMETDVTQPCQSIFSTDRLWTNPSRTWQIFKHGWLILVFNLASRPHNMRESLCF